MGIRGLTTFISNRSEQYLDDYQLHDSYVVLDAPCVAMQLYKWQCTSNDCFGGDYDKYAKVVRDFLQLLFDCNVTPLIVTDGGYEKRKLKTIFGRMKNRVETSKRLTPVSEGTVSVFPLFVRFVFIDVAKSLNIQCFCCTFEGDAQTAFLAKSLNCPVISYDSDYYIFDCLYIPLSTVDFQLRKKKSYNYIPCQVYNVDKFLNSYGGMNKVNLPLLAVLLGNDYITKSSFAPFYRHLKLQKGKQNEQQRTIKTVILWLQNETPDSALQKILSRYKLHARKRIAAKIHAAIKSYQSVDTQILSYFNVELKNQQEIAEIKLPKLEDIPDNSTEDCTMEDEEESASNDDDEYYDEDAELVSKLPDKFKDKLKRCIYPPSFIDMKLNNTFFCFTQLEDLYSPHSHTISMNILRAIHKILTGPAEKTLTCVARDGHSNIKRHINDLYQEKLPTFADIDNLDLNQRKAVLSKVLNMTNLDALNSVPSSWHLFLITLGYWVINSERKIDISFIYSAIICGIVLNHVDDKAGFYRTTRAFLNKYPKTDSSLSSETPPNHFIPENLANAAIEKIDLQASVECLRRVIYYFQMDIKMRGNPRLYDRVIVHQFACLQTCFLHIKNLNIILDYPFPDFMVSKFFDGTFLYNMVTEFKKRSDLKGYLKILLQGCPSIMNSLQLLVDVVLNMIESKGCDNISETSNAKRRRKRRNRKSSGSKNEGNDNEVQDNLSEGEGVVDPHNFYSVLKHM